ncbi:uncharacterized protein LOC34618849 [Cyclospora cayetanensis]|uniref:Uncharacterized protein LOC34618849 n=1 Tax=Cyclospora cayetanensis TaxID=88456 RepID=A0A6P6RYV3_9EIME|nr:uncharacterized protein LOC34618849 [Cyclospora cayetanensis]
MLRTAGFLSAAAADSCVPARVSIAWVDCMGASGRLCLLKARNLPGSFIGAAAARQRQVSLHWRVSAARGLRPDLPKGSSNISCSRPVSRAVGDMSCGTINSASNVSKRRNFSSSSSSVGGSHYATLGAYVALALQLHPDKNKDDPNAASRFHEVRVAYDVLSQPFSRSHYDRQCEGARGMAAAMEDAGAAAWGEETEEQRTLRRQRYQRYAAEQRTDVPYDDTPGVVPVIVCAFLAITYFSVAYPKAREMEECYGVHDEVTPRDTRGDPLVRAFYNPLSDQWERIPRGYDAPLPSILHRMYSVRHPSLRLETSQMPRQFAVLQMPHSQTEPSRLVRDPRTGEHLWTGEIPVKRSGPSNSSNSRSSDCSLPTAHSPAEKAGGLSVSSEAKPPKSQGVAALCI